MPGGQNKEPNKAYWISEENAVDIPSPPSLPYWRGVLHERHTGQSHILATGFRGLDSIEEASDGTLYVSSFDGGAVYKMDADGTNPMTLISGVGFKITADMALDEANGRLLVPDTAHGTVIILPTTGGTPLP